MAIPNPYPNIADDVKSDVTTYSSNKIESLISAATEVPVPASGDAGKVLAVKASEDGYELESLADVATTGDYTDLINTPDVPTLTVIDKDDFFVDSTEVVNFDAVQYGKLIIVNRFKLGNCSYPGTTTVQANVKTAFLPASTIRFSFDEGAGTDMHVGYILDDGKIQTIGFTSAETDMNAAAFAYFIN